MDTTESVIASFGGNQHRECYKNLCYAISIEREHQPRTPKMQELVTEVSMRTSNASPRTIGRSLARAIEDLWNYGDKTKLVSFNPSWKRYRPKPQEFIQTIARYLWEEE